jgi:hypothetical protein
MPSSSVPTTSPTAPKLAAKDGGAPSANAKDAGAPSPSAKPAQVEDLEARKRLAAGRCEHMQMLLRSNDAKTNDMARMVRDQECLMASSLSPNSGAANCDRVVCRQACAALQDQTCLRNLDFAERALSLPY